MSIYRSTPGPPGQPAKGLGCLLPASLATHLAPGLAPVLAATSLVAIAGDAAPAFPPVALAPTPLYAAPVVDKPAMALALSVEFPTAGAQYTSGAEIDSSYTADKEYLGYFDAEACYNYNDNPAQPVAAPHTSADYKRFDRAGAAAGRKCADAFSGNFLNWAGSSTIDMIRLALSGGDRIIDEPGLSILQRAMIPGENSGLNCMWNSRYFPPKLLPKDAGGSGSYWGAVPAAMRADANGHDILVGNVYDRIYFGTLLSRECGDPSYITYTLGSYGTQRSIGPVADWSAAPPTDQNSIPCGGEGYDCNFPGIRQVWYGAADRWRVAPAANGVLCSNAVFQHPQPGYGKSCRISLYTGNWRPQIPPGALNSDGYFFARAQVCNTAAGRLQDARDYKLCRQYPDGNYKPAGVIQKYSDQMRVAAFGYLLDQTPSSSGGRYGGVLRAPMKYAGPTTYDIHGVNNTPSGGNPNAEWDLRTGVFKRNPDNVAPDPAGRWPAVSGVINYLNKFGRTGSPGIYKQYDPVGELHYEALRYLQGLQPDAAAIRGPVDATMADGFPYAERWTDPYGASRSSTGDYSCVKSNIVVVADAQTHDGNRLPTASAGDNIPDIAHWRSVVQKFESNQGGNYIDGQGEPRSIANPNAANPLVPTEPAASQIMGSAYWARTHDIRGRGWTATEKQRPGLRVKTMVFDVNEGGRQNDRATRRTANQLFMAAKYGGFEIDPGNPERKPYNTRGNPFQDHEGANNNDVWQKSDNPGEASSYYFSDTSRPRPARDILAAFESIFSRVSVSMRSMAGSGLSTGSEISNGSVLYSAKFDPENWSGDVVAQPISQNASHALLIGGPLWSAAQKLDEMESPASERNIIIGGIGQASPATDFRWEQMSAQIRQQLSRANPSAQPDSLGDERVLYLRGDRSNEGDGGPIGFRVRRSLLGDIVNSNISYSGAPPKKFTGPGYAAFRSRYGARTPAVFAGANDGMLHAFDADTGKELFAYIPSWLARNLPALTAPGFVNSHQNYVDAPSTVAQAQVTGDNSNAEDWKTVLVSGTGAGGSGVFALDVSDPASFSAANVLWEFTRLDDPDMGQVVGSPKILKFKTTGRGANASYRWFAVLGSGVNNYVPDPYSGGRYSASGRPALFLLALDKPAGAPWALNDNYYKVSLPVDSAVAQGHATGLANFSVLYGNHGEVTDIYAGDLHGALWKLWFGNKPPTEWNIDMLSAFNKGTRTRQAPYPLYIARSGDFFPQVQPIFAAPALFVGPRISGVETFYVLIGTGKYLEPVDNDRSRAVQQTLYAIYDNGKTRADTSPVGASAISGRGRLRKATVDTAASKVTVAPFRWGRPRGRARTDDMAPATERAGWYFDFPETGERMDNAVLDLGSLLAAINTKIPPAGSAPGGGCASGAMGGGNQYVLNINTGAADYMTSGVGLLGAPIFLSNYRETVLRPADGSGRRVRTRTLRRITQGQGGIDPNTDFLAPIAQPDSVGRLSWRRIFNYRDLKHAPSQ